MPGKNRQPRQPQGRQSQARQAREVDSTGTLEGFEPPGEPTGDGAGTSATRSPDAESGAEGLAFEQALESLEAIVDELEDGELALEASLERFERGVRLSRLCADQLAVARRRIELLAGGEGDDAVAPFEPGDASDRAGEAGEAPDD